MKNNCIDCGIEISEFATRCRRCHMLTNFNREYWQKLFQEKLSKIYNYQYNNGEIIIKI